MNDCPFCQETDFDLNGLRQHLQMYCENFSMEVLRDAEGDPLYDGDHVTFSYGIPPRRSHGILQLRGREMWVLTPDDNPKESTLADLIECVELVYKT